MPQRAFGIKPSTSRRINMNANEGLVQSIEKESSPAELRKTMARLKSRLKDVEDESLRTIIEDNIKKVDGRLARLTRKKD